MIGSANFGTTNFMQYNRREKTNEICETVRDHYRDLIYR